MFYKNVYHSAKGSEWKDHKYIKRIDGTYYYPENYEGGRHLSDKDTKALADETIRGNFGNGQKRKDLLGGHYKQVQGKVNEILGVKKIEKVENVKESDKKATNNAVEKTKDVDLKSTKKSKGINLDSVYSVYRKKK